MDTINIFLSIYISIIFLSAVPYGVHAEEGCYSPQYLEIGARGTVRCAFQEGYYGILWYNSKNYITDTSIIHYQESVKGGEGYESGEFDIRSDGSLIINNVSLDHDHYFTAVKLNLLSDDFIPHYVRVVSIVKPDQQYPIIRPCINENPVCFTIWNANTSIACSIEGSRPVLHVAWFALTAQGDWNIQSDINVTRTGVLSTSVATIINPFEYSALLSLLACKAQGPTGMLTNNESLILVQSDEVNLFSIKPDRRYFQRHSRPELSCTASTSTFVVWKIQKKALHVFDTIVYGAFTEDITAEKVSNGYVLGDNGSLIIPNFDIHHEAIYGCIKGNGTEEEMATFEIIAFVPPVPFNLHVRGCPIGEYCSLEMERQGNLTCTVKGVRPKVKLGWKTLHHFTSRDIVFSKGKTKVTRNHDDTFDISTTTAYDAVLSSYLRLEVKCQIFDEEIDIFHLSRYVVLVFPEDENGDANSFYWLITTPVVIVLLSVTLVSAGFLYIKGNRSKRRKSTTNVHEEAMSPMLGMKPSNSPAKEENNLKRDFLCELKGKYKELCSSINPVPFLQGEERGIENVFVEGGLYFLNVKEKFGSAFKLEPLKSYRDMFSDPRMSSNRRIIEGDPGIGKSTLTLQWAYEWITKDKLSCFKNVDIFILLRLRQLGNVKSIYEAVRQFLLPTDTRLEVNDIQSIIRKSKSTVIILDGFDEYASGEDGTPTDVVRVLQQDILRQCQVILTTRSSCLPNEYAHLTKRFKLNGFDDKARDAYLRKAIVHNDKDAEKIKEKLRGNPFLVDLCQVPLFFVMFAHIANEKLNVTKFKSVTLFFRYIISCFHSHMKNKMKDANVGKHELYENDHFKLDEISFRAIFSRSKQISWGKEYLMNQLGKDFYKTYVRIGILVEEDVLWANEDTNKLESDPYIYKTEVRFYHKLFCEWYAAHFLAKYLENPQDMSYANVAIEFVNNDHENVSSELPKSQTTFETQLLGNADPYELQYLYRFTCGLSFTAAEKVYDYLKSRYGGEKFYVLCLLEQSENYQQMESSISQLCSTNIIIHENHSRLLQRTTIQLLQIASQSETSIKQLQLFNCFLSDEFSGNNLLLKSHIKLPILSSLSKLIISDRDREINKRDLIGIFNFCWHCSLLTVLQFDFCLMPSEITTEILHVKQRRLQVLWRTEFSSSYRLNFNSGRWEHQDGRLMSNAEYRKEADSFKKLQKK